MKLEDYFELQKEQLEISSKTKKEIIHRSALGIAGEGGEVAEWVKKHYYHDKVMDLHDLKLELGDVLCYLVQMCLIQGFDIEEIMELNKDKIISRRK